MSMISRLSLYGDNHQDKVEDKHAYTIDLVDIHAESTPDLLKQTSWPNFGPRTTTGIISGERHSLAYIRLTE